MASDGQGKYALKDRYDWQNQDLFQGATLRTGDIAVFLEKLGVNGSEKLIKKYLPSGEILKVDDMDGWRLQEAGLAVPFDIQSQWEISEINLKIPKKLTGYAD